MFPLTRAFSWLALPFLMAAQTQPVATTTTQTSAASANFAYVSDDGCVQNEVIVFASQTTLAAPGKAPQTNAEVTYSRYRYDFCEDTDLGTDLGTSSQPMFAGDLSRASLNTTIHGHTASGGTVSVSFILSWNGQGTVTSRAPRPQSPRPGAARLISGENLSRNAIVTGIMDEREISAAAVAASLHTARKSLAR